MDEELLYICAIALWKTGALNSSGSRDLDREFVEMLDSDREPYLAGAREVLRAYLAAAEPAPTQDRGNYTDADYVRLHKAHCYTADKLAAAEARNAALIEALRKLMLGYVNLLEIGRDRIISLGGSCDDVSTMERGDPCLIAARAALPAHRDRT